MNLRESVIIGPVNRWLGQLFDGDHRERTIDTLVEAHNADANGGVREALRRRISEAVGTLERHRGAIEAGVDPQILVEPMNSAHAEKAIAQRELDNLPQVVPLNPSKLHDLIDSLGDIASVLDAGSPSDRARIYDALDLQIRYSHTGLAADVAANPRVVSTGVRRGT
ncbi:hypothetical protein [Nocardia stercoris]|nr:hypothetical protein [Nocardia stercoris]RMI33241.1 hypothetical protein EBN03_08595 [Nocardia stercoris]